MNKTNLWVTKSELNYSQVKLMQKEPLACHFDQKTVLFGQFIKKKTWQALGCTLLSKSELNYSQVKLRPAVANLVPAGFFSPPQLFQMPAKTFEWANQLEIRCFSLKMVFLATIRFCSLIKMPANIFKPEYLPDE